MDGLSLTWIKRVPGDTDSVGIYSGWLRPRVPGILPGPRCRKAIFGRPLDLLIVAISLSGGHVICEAAKAAGASAKMLRHYERIGLLPGQAIRVQHLVACVDRDRASSLTRRLQWVILMLYFSSMTRFLHHVFLVLIGFAIIGGTSVQLAHAAMMEPQSAMAGMPCDMAGMPMTDAGSGKPMVPCKGLTPDCIKQIGCVVDIAIVARLVAFDMRVWFAPLEYWQTRFILFGTDRTPDLMPPRTI